MDRLAAAAPPAARARTRHDRHALNTPWPTPHTPSHELNAPNTPCPHANARTHMLNCLLRYLVMIGDDAGLMMMMKTMKVMVMMVVVIVMVIMMVIMMVMVVKRNFLCICVQLCPQLPILSFSYPLSAPPNVTI